VRRLIGRVGLPRASGALLAAAILASVPASAQAAPPSLFPDLVTLRPKDLSVQRGADGTPVLRLENAVANRGAGPLELQPSGESANCDGDNDPTNDRDDFQRVYRDADANGIFDRAIDTEFYDTLAGCRTYHPKHHHWHFGEFAEYRLNTLEGETVASSTKVSFCVIDTLRRYPGLPGSPASKVYPLVSEVCDEIAVQGLSVGWADVYGALLPGQRIRLRAVDRGTYCLVSEADPAGLLIESDDTNNARELRVRLDPRAGTVDPKRRDC
jgi:hypothetical protein